MSFILIAKLRLRLLNLIKALLIILVCSLILRHFYDSPSILFILKFFLFQGYKFWEIIALILLVLVEHRSFIKSFNVCLSFRLLSCFLIVCTLMKHWCPMLKILLMGLSLNLINLVFYEERILNILWEVWLTIGILIRFFFIEVY